MQETGHPVAGDKKYGALTNPLKRLGLHAHQLSFIHPVTGEKLHFETKYTSRLFEIISGLIFPWHRSSTGKNQFPYR